MGRPREFDEDQALEKAMEVFWAKGYEASSLCDLTQAMGLSRSSFYEAFGSKHDLFLATIERYCNSAGGRFAEMLRRSPPGRAAIAAVFAAAIDKALGDGDTRGCYLGNCSTQVAPDDTAVWARVRGGMKQIEETFHEAIVRGRAAGNIRSSRDDRALARYLASSLNGLQITAKTQPERAVLEDIVRIVLTSLD